MLDCACGNMKCNQTCISTNAVCYSPLDDDEPPALFALPLEDLTSNPFRDQRDL